MKTPLTNRYDFVMIFDVKDGNPNGDPDAGNLPRIDPETGQGIVTDVCLKRKVRNYIQLTKADSAQHQIFIREKAILNQLLEQAYKDIDIDLTKDPQNPRDGKKRNKAGQGQGTEVYQARDKMCADYFDIRTFGAVMSTGPNAGQVRGPVQITFGRSVNPVVVHEHSITRMAVTKEADAEKHSGGNRTFGRKNTIPYGLYVTYGFISPQLAAQTGFSEEDLQLFWQALQSMFEYDHSAARGMMATQKLVVFKHQSPLGNSPSQKLFKRVKLELINKNLVPRDFSNYKCEIDRNDLPNEVEILELV